jgi:peptidoglycan-associated lipoprotein
MPIELALEYTYAHSNAPPASCSCFNLNGSSATFAWSIPPRTALGNFAFVTDFTSVHAGGISATGHLTLSALTMGARYRPNIGHLPLHPCAQALAGFAHASGTLAQAPNSGVANAGAALAANLGGGIDLRLSRRFSYRLAEADYMLTTFNNGANNHQNNLKIGTGAVVHF